MCSLPCFILSQAYSFHSLITILIMQVSVVFYVCLTNGSVSQSSLILLILAGLTAVPALLCNYRRFPITGCSNGFTCNRFAGMCDLDGQPNKLQQTDGLDFQAYRKTTKVSTPSSQRTTTSPERNGFTLLGRMASSLANYGKDYQTSDYTYQTSLPEATIPKDQEQDLAGYSSSLKMVLPTYQPTMSRPNVEHGLSAVVIVLICLSAFITMLLLISCIYILCRLLRRPVDVFSTSADVFDMSILSVTTH